MAGDITLKRNASSALTVTNLHSLASSTDWTAGWTSAAIDCSTYRDIKLSGTFTTHASNRQAGQINIWAYSALNDTPDWPDVFSSGTEGTEGAATIHDSEQRESAFVLLKTIVVDNGASEIYTFPQINIAPFFGGDLPTDIAIFVSQNCTTTTTAGLAASGSALYITPIYDQYT